MLILDCYSVGSVFLLALACLGARFWKFGVWLPWIVFGIVHVPGMIMALDLTFAWDVFFVYPDVGYEN